MCFQSVQKKKPKKDNHITRTDRFNPLADGIGSGQYCYVWVIVELACYVEARLSKVDKI